MSPIYFLHYFNVNPRYCEYSNIFIISLYYYDLCLLYVFMFAYAVKYVGLYMSFVYMHIDVYVYMYNAIHAHTSSSDYTIISV